MRKMNEKWQELAPYALHLAMVVAVGVYVIIGAFAIREIEAMPKFERRTQNTPQIATSRLKRDQHEIRRFSVNRTRKCVIAAIEKIGKLTNCTKVTEGSYLGIIDDCYEHDLRKMLEIARRRQNRLHHNADSNQISVNSSSESVKEYEYWSVMDSVLFCFTVVTTIGYGNVAPRSFPGRLFVILYGLVGVPFTMLAIANLGKFLATVLKTWARPFVNCLRRFRRRHFKRKYSPREKQRLMEKESKKPNKADDGDSDEEDEDGEEGGDSADGIILFLSFVIYIVVGSMAIAAYEPEMDFFEAVYFNFVTLTTIGLGDLVPQSETYLVITLLYCAIGLALTTIAIEIAADTLKKLHYFGRKAENVGTVQVWFGGKKISMRALVKNLGDQFNVPVNELENLNMDKFVEDAIKVEEGELTTLRVDRDWMNSNYWRAIESGSMHYVDDDDLVTIRSNQSDFLQHLAESRSFMDLVEVSGHAPFLPSPTSIISNQQANEIEEPGTSGIANCGDLPIQQKGERPILVPSEATSALLRSYREAKRDKEVLEGKYSAEARRRYEEYQQTWLRYKRTAKTDKKSEPEK